MKFSQRFSKFGNNFRRTYYIEFLVFIFNLSQGFRTSANFPLFYSKVCHEVYLWTPQVCSNLNKTAENFVQQKTAQWLLYKELLSFLPTLVMAMFFGSFADKYGTKVPALIAIASMALDNFLYMVFVSMPIFPVYVLMIQAFVISLGGSTTVFAAATHAEAAKQMEDKTKITQRFAVLTACRLLPMFIAFNLSSIFMKYCSLEWIVIMAQIILTVSFLTGLALYSNAAKETMKIRNTVPNIPNDKCVNSVNSNETVATHREEAHASRPDPMEWIHKILNIFKSVWNTLTKTRPNHGRAYLFLHCFVGIFYSCADSGIDVVTSLYVFHEPLSWTPAMFSVWMATMNIIQLVCGLLGTYLLKHYKFTDYTVVLVGLTSTILTLVCTSVASHTWIMYLALTLGCVSNLGIPSLRSLIIQLGPSEETAELTSMLSIVYGWSKLIGSVVCNNIYTVTLNHFTGATFAVMASLLLICFFVMLGLACHSKKIVK